MESLHFVRDLADELYHSLKKSDISKLGEILHRGWEAKKKFAKGVSNEKIDLMYQTAQKNGAIGGKLTGAGGGGHLLLYAESSKHPKIINEMKKLGLIHVPFAFHSSGPKILNLYDLNK